MLCAVSDQLSDWVDRKQCSHDFISAVTKDLKKREEGARQKVCSLSLAHGNSVYGNNNTR